jgi:hypothetical protein
MAFVVIIRKAYGDAALAGYPNLARKPKSRKLADAPAVVAHLARKD